MQGFFCDVLDDVCKKMTLKNRKIIHKNPKVFFLKFFFSTTVHIIKFILCISILLTTSTVYSLLNAILCFFMLTLKVVDPPVLIPDNTLYIFLSLDVNNIKMQLVMLPKTCKAKKQSKEDFPAKKNKGLTLEKNVSYFI